ncbi:MULTISPECIES: ABC transporter ATP-binding protein [Delftia]|uniref:ABC transporter ATP-binding protein n=1 Tax=Delftia TaxID=80865 RepID=UPI000F83D65E|nr:MULTISPECIES: ABC transporter ATP-binding protein [Delftia]WEL97618.1 ABC transporter ATP-binding protein [Delftia tsuruhatensis]WQM84195.1 ABC transporter ATP-binding protein [Delftia tsuruhatensis]
MSSDIAISVSNISKRYEMYANPKDRLLQFFSLRSKQYFEEFWALRNVSFSVGKGETIGILGRNGSGKSTLLQIIAGTLAPTSGEIKTNGILTALLELGSGFNPEFTGRDNVYLNGTILGLSREQMDSHFDNIASFADIGLHLDQPVKTYSSGMVVRLAFAVQACISPQILIVDEALSVGDEKFQRKCFDYIERLRGNGCSILLVTHSTATVEKFCQRGVLLHKGEVHGVGPAKEIVDQYHALLYSDERSYLRYMNQSSRQAVDKASSIILADDNHIEKSQDDDGSFQEKDGLRAVISNWGMYNSVGEVSEVFYTGDKAIVQFEVDVLKSVEEIQAGILIRTVEGVSAFGTSTLYHDCNQVNARKGTKLVFSFDIELSLCPGSYFITLAIAEAISHGDMAYLDRKTDAIIIKVDQIRLMGSGIAMLKSSAKVVGIEA